jgi:hypothetical protein
MPGNLLTPWISIWAINARTWWLTLSWSSPTVTIIVSMNSLSRRGRRWQKKAELRGLFEAKNLNSNSDTHFLILMSVPQESGLSLASVVRIPARMGTWPKLDDEESLAQLHAKFWGKSMAEEEQEWRNAQSPIPAIGDYGDEGQDRDERMDVDLDEDGDIIRGCYVLDIEGLGFSKIWIRADYIRIYDYLEIHYKKRAVPAGRAPAGVITGQPGIGEFPNIAETAWC